jgi:PAS domain-containing protein
MYSRLVYDDWDSAGEIWNIRPDDSSITDYTENIAALYAIYSGTLGKLSLSAGLRGEYTFVNPRYRKFTAAGSETDEDGKRQDYFDLFPNVNLSYPLNESYSNTLVLAYSRRISRPDFSYLSPFRNQLSEYSQIAGNPDLRAMYSNDLSLTGVLAYK